MRNMPFDKTKYKEYSIKPGGFSKQTRRLLSHRQYLKETNLAISFSEVNIIFDSGLPFLVQLKYLSKMKIMKVMLC